MSLLTEPWCRVHYYSEKIVTWETTNSLIEISMGVQNYPKRKSVSIKMNIIEDVLIKRKVGVFYPHLESVFSVSSA